MPRRSAADLIPWDLYLSCPIADFELSSRTSQRGLSTLRPTEVRVTATEVRFSLCVRFVPPSSTFSFLLPSSFSLPPSLSFSHPLLFSFSVLFSSFFSSLIFFLSFSLSLSLPSFLPPSHLLSFFYSFITLFSLSTVNSTSSSNRAAVNSLYKPCTQADPSSPDEIDGRGTLSPAGDHREIIRG